MDTLGTISPKHQPITETAPRLEAFERLRYLGESGKVGVLEGTAGTGKTELFNQLARRLRRDGVAVAQLNLTGVGGPELAFQFASKLGLGVSVHTPELEVWVRLQEYAESTQLLNRPMAFLLDHLDRAKESVATPLLRMMDLFGQAAWLFSTRVPCAERWKNLLRDRGALRVELQEMQPREAAQVISRQLAIHAPDLHFSPDGLAALHELSGGKMSQVKQLVELTALAAEAEGESEINSEMVRGLTQEFVGIGD